MNATERVFLSNDLLTFSFLFGVLLLFLMKVYKPKRLLGYSIAFFTQGFIKNNIENKVSFFSTFQILLFAFSIFTITIFIFSQPFFEIEKDVIHFFQILIGVSIYFSCLFFVEFLLAAIFNLSDKIQYFLTSKTEYLYNLCLWIFPVLILYNYAFRSSYFLFSCSFLLLVFRLYLIVDNNKNLIFSKLFYFILYFCTLELVPLLIVYKITTA